MYIIKGLTCLSEELEILKVRGALTDFRQEVTL